LPYVERIIECQVAIDTDDTLTADERQAILAFCREPIQPPAARHAVPLTADRWLTRKQAAATLAVSVRTVQRLVKSGKLPSRLILGCRRIPASSLTEPGTSDKAIIWPSRNPTVPTNLPKEMTGGEWTQGLRRRGSPAR